MVTPGTCKSLEPNGAQCRSLHTVDENSPSQDGSYMIGGEGIKTSKRSGDTEEKVKMCVINEGSRGGPPCVQKKTSSDPSKIMQI